MKLIAALASAFILTACAANNNAPRRAVFSPIMPESERKQLPSDRYTAGEMYSQAYDALVIREGPGVSMGSRYAANYKGTQIVCGAGNYGAGRDKFSFIVTAQVSAAAIRPA